MMKIFGVTLLLLLVSILLSGCMRYHSDRANQNTLLEMTEAGKDGAKFITTAKYATWGRGNGTDGIYGTGDDDIESYTRVGMDAQEHPTTANFCTNKGSDGLWFTSDDEMVELFRYEKEGDKESWTYSGGLVDPTILALGEILMPPSSRRFLPPSREFNFPSYWGGDMRGVLPNRFDKRNNIVKSLSSRTTNSPGYFYDGFSPQSDIRLIRTKTNDGFLIRNFNNFKYQESNNKDVAIEGEWRVKTNGLLTTIARFDSAGTDNKWGTADDNFRYGIQVEFNSSGEIIAEKHVSHFGIDGLPFTDDDKYLLAAEQRIFSKGSETISSIHSRFVRHPDGANGGVSIQDLPDEETLMTVNDSAYWPDVWQGPKRYVYASSGGSVWHLSSQEVIVSNSGINGDDSKVIELVGKSENVCILADVYTLDPCLSILEKNSAGSHGTRIIQQILADTVLMESRSNSSPMPSDPSNMTRVFIDRIRRP